MSASHPIRWQMSPWNANGSGSRVSRVGAAKPKRMQEISDLAWTSTGNMTPSHRVGQGLLKSMAYLVVLPPRLAKRWKHGLEPNPGDVDGRRAGHLATRAPTAGATQKAWEVPVLTLAGLPHAFGGTSQ